MEIANIFVNYDGSLRFRLVLQALVATTFVCALGMLATVTRASTFQCSHPKAIHKNEDGAE